MLGKLFKHEFKETAKPLVPLNLILIVFTIIGAILLGSNIFQNNSMGFLAATSMTLYVLSIIAAFIISAVYLTIRFYRTMYSNQGYLTHTLPVSTSATLNTKLFVAAFWILITFIITVLSIFLLVRITIGNEWDSAAIADAVAGLQFAWGMSISEFMAYIIVSVILSCFYMILMIAASLAIGQLFNQYRVVAAIVTYIIFYIIQQIIGLFSVVILGIGNADTLLMIDETAATASAEIGTFYRETFLAGIIQSVVFSIIFYIICHYITNKRLNLE